MQSSVTWQYSITTREQVGIENSILKIVDIESFIGNNKTWHLIFDYLALTTSMNVSKGKGLEEAKWFEIDRLPSCGGICP